jgi:hypothetical protein
LSATDPPSREEITLNLFLSCRLLRESGAHDK